MSKLLNLDDWCKKHKIFWISNTIYFKVVDRRGLGNVYELNKLYKLVNGSAYNMKDEYLHAGINVVDLHYEFYKQPYSKVVIGGELI